MVRSMTGYGRGEEAVDGRALTVEVKTVNHRFLNVTTRLPMDLLRFEPEVLGLVKKHLQRGQVNVFASWNGGGAEGPAVQVNVEAARAAAEALRRVCEAAGLADEVRLEHVLAVPSVLTVPTTEADPEELWARCAPVFERALMELDAFRAREGKDLAADVVARLRSIVGFVETIEGRTEDVVRSYRERLTRRAEELVQSVPAELVSERVAMEVALFADRSDVSEEVVRLRSHVEKFTELLETGGVVGRKLDFLLQEMNRESNTIGSKGTDAEISRLVVELKSELEKIREQIQNME